MAIIDDSAYHGYHLMYFVGTGDPYRTVLVRNDLANKDMEAFEASLVTDLQYQELFAMR